VSGVVALLDATVVRAVLLPASMKLVGDWNRYLPRWLRWLPETAPRMQPREVTNPETGSTTSVALQMLV
jgi:hypothetical protein